MNGNVVMSLLYPLGSDSNINRTKVESFLKTNMAGQQAALFAFILQLADRFGPLQLNVLHESPNMHVELTHNWNGTGKVDKTP